MWTAPPPSTTTAIASAATRRGRRSASRKGHSRRNKYPRGHRQVAFPLLRRHVSWRANHRFISPSRRCVLRPNRSWIAQHTETIHVDVINAPGFPDSCRKRAGAPLAARCRSALAGNKVTD
jgi:hypothetical protein